MARELDLGFLRPVALPQSHPHAQEKRLDLAALAGEQFIGYPSRHRSVVADATVDACHRAGFEPRMAIECAEAAVDLAVAHRADDDSPHLLRALTLLRGLFPDPVPSPDPLRRH